MARLSDIASMCGVSPSTVSNVLNGKMKVSEATKKRVLDAVEETGYQPNFYAQGMRSRSSKLIGIITEGLGGVPTAPIVIDHIMSMCEDAGFRTILVNLRMYYRYSDTWYHDDTKLAEVVRPAVAELLSMKVAGIVYVAGHCRRISALPDDLEIPVIVAYGISANPKYPSVYLDDEQGGYEMARHILDMGHRRIGIMAGARDNFHTQQRLKGCQKALYEAGVLYDPSLVSYANWDRDSAFCCAQRFIDAKVTAVMCMNDRMAAGVYDCLYADGLRPGVDMSVTGYDNTDFSEYLWPYLTSYDMDLVGLGLAVGQLMTDMLSGSAQTASGVRKEIPGHMVKRDSVSKPEGAA